jgi:hypothetical protein
MKISKHMREFLLKNPSLFKGYTKFLTITTKAMVYSLDNFIKHFAVIKGVYLKDPWKETVDYLSQNFDRMQYESYIDNIYSKVKNPAFSKEDYYKITNLSGLDDHVCTCKKAKVFPKKPVKRTVQKTSKKSICKKPVSKKATVKKTVKKSK